MKAFLMILSVLLLFVSGAFAQSTLKIEKIENTDSDKSDCEVGFSTVLQGTVTSQDKAVYALVQDPNAKTWRIFRAVLDSDPDTSGLYHWRVICQFGKLNGSGVGSSYRVKAVAFDKAYIKANGLPRKLSSTVLNSNSILLKRTR